MVLDATVTDEDIPFSSTNRDSILPDKVTAVVLLTTKLTLLGGGAGEGDGVTAAADRTHTGVWPVAFPPPKLTLNWKLDPS